MLSARQIEEVAKAVNYFENQLLAFQPARYNGSLSVACIEARGRIVAAFTTSVADLLENSSRI
jgi:hypothetical protein